MRRRDVRQRPWTKPHEDWLREWYGKLPLWEVCKRLWRSKRAVRIKAVRLGITASYAARRQTTPEAYFEIVRRVATAARIPKGEVHSEAQNRRVVSVRHRIWAELADSGEGVKSIADLSGFDHCSVIRGIRRHRERVAQMQREAAE